MLRSVTPLPLRFATACHLATFLPLVGDCSVIVRVPLAGSLACVHSFWSLVVLFCCMLLPTASGFWFQKPNPSRKSSASPHVTPRTIARVVRFGVRQLPEYRPRAQLPSRVLRCTDRVNTRDANMLMKLLKPGGIMVGPFDNKLQWISCF